MNQQAAREKPAELTSDTNADQPSSLTAALSADAAVASSVGFSSDADALSHSEGLPEGPALSAHDPDFFSDSYSHITTSPDEPSATQLSIETLGGAEPAQEEQRLSLRGSAHHLSEEKGTHDGTELEICARTSDVEKSAGMCVCMYRLRFPVEADWAPQDSNVYVMSAIGAQFVIKTSQWCYFLHLTNNYFHINFKFLKIKNKCLFPPQFKVYRVNEQTVVFPSNVVKLVSAV